MPLDLSNWSKADPDSEKNYNRVTRLPIGEESMNMKQKLLITSNIRTGDYKIFATDKKQFGGNNNEDILIYSYDADEDDITINDTNYYAGIFERKGGNRTLNKLNSEVRLDTYNLASENQNTRSDVKKFESLGKKPGYKSAFNQAVVPPQSIVSPVVEPFRIRINNASRRDVSTRFTPNTDIDGGGSIDDTTSSIDSGRSTDDKTSSSSRSLGLQNAGVSNYMRYPMGRLPSLGYDYIQIRAFKYAPVGLPKAYSGERKKAKDRLVEATGDIIQLPMIGSISETNAVSWSDDFIGEIQNIAAGIAFNNINGGGDPFSAVFDALKDVTNSVQLAAAKDDVKQAISAYFAGQAAGVPNVLQRNTGQMINNNLELLFSGPNLRSFNFAFNLRPRDKAEADMCRQIIRSLKASSAPKLSDDYMFLETPDVFKLEYIYNSSANTTISADASPTEHPYMNKIKPCALTGLSVNYTPEGSYATYEDGGSMTGYDLSLSFKELEPVYQKDQLDAGKENMGY
jgi:hypothetical protein